ncbi:triple tyrosine motif-containing protein [Stenotrophomonas sp. HITSZ_GD]|uniref:sensor histidine kinase n=1 Tax=Stenotrophomonas sp. HITSZ_GD TaxID=3037248 RepID=UPI00240E9152|nr:sensor histidine kinase [Stenotrophomonas sp. HITSZ_GD]MDG2524237.1 triple tyrosine motif-containing protein [Stenotrophomonas sp. HITSZ_GD]
MLLFACLASWVPGARALDPALHIAQFHHVAWTVKEGAPGGVTALAQTQDGYLWLATQVGLFRFDGLKFERFALAGSETHPAAAISTLFAPTTGGLWIGYRYGGISFVDPRGRTTHFGIPEGLPTGTVYRITEASDHTLWAATFNGLYAHRQGRWQEAAPELGLPPGVARTVFVDRAGTLWVASDDAVHFRRKGEARFSDFSKVSGRVVQFAQSADGAMWVANLDSGVHPLVAPGARPVSPLGHSSAGLLFDRDGTLWAPTLGDGLIRLAHPDAAQAATPRDTQQFNQSMGLSSDNLLPILEDREGNIWVGGSSGVDRFRASRLIPARVPLGAQDFALVPQVGGGVLAGSRNKPVLRLRAASVDTMALAPPITAAYRDRNGAIWLGGPKGIWRLQDGALEKIAPLPVPRYSGVQSITLDNEGALWVSINTPGVFRLKDGHWRQLGPQDYPSFPPTASPLALLATRDDEVWMAFARNAVMVVRGDQARLLTEQQGLRVGNVSTLHEADAGIWIGGERGIAFATRAGIRSRIAKEGSALRGVSGIVQAADGSLWMNGARGVVRIPADKVPHLFDPDFAESDCQLFDYLDGLPGVANQFRPVPTAILADDGRLWFATTNAVVSVDPASTRHNALPPPVQIQSVQADEQAFNPDAEPVALPANLSSLRIAYTAMSLSIPERVRFKYQLEGHDAGWLDAGGRREAAYTNLAPGRYTFRVAAANEDGVWSTQPAAVQIAIAPRFYQTWWFTLLWAALLVVAACVAYLLRLRQLSRRIRDRLQERHGERERIARELHDTLLQSIQGLILRFQAVSESLPPLDPARSALEHALQRADEVLIEGRDKVLDLRACAPEDATLEELLAEAASELSLLTQAHLEVSVQGTPGVLDPVVREEAYRIVREAMLNACRHAGAGSIRVLVRHQSDGMHAAVVDEGPGIDATTLAQGGRGGHWGMRGMRERAQRIGAQLLIDSRPGEGTRVALYIAGGKSYRPARGPSRGNALRGIFRRRPP